MRRFSLPPAFGSTRLAARRVATACLGALACAIGAAAQAQEAITIVVPYAQNGPTDRTLRAMAGPLSQALGGARVTVKNVASAGGVAGLAEVAKAAPDGRTLLFTNTNVGLLPALGQPLPFDARKDLAPLGLVFETPMVLLARPDMPAGTDRELAQWLAQTDGAKVRLTDAGAGSASYLCGLLVQSMVGKRFSRTEFPGSAPALTALKEGKADLLCDQTPTVKAPLAAGAVKGYAVSTARPLAVPPFEPLPTFRRMFSRNLELTIWHGFYAPAGVPPEQQKRLSAAIRQAAADPRFVAQLQSEGVVMVQGSRQTPEGHRRFIDETVPLYQVIVSRPQGAAR